MRHKTLRIGFVLSTFALSSSCGNQGVVLEPAGTSPPPTTSLVRVDVLAAGPYHTCGIDSGRLLCWGSNSNGELGLGDTTMRSTPTSLDGSDWKEIVAGETHTCARRLAGSVWCWGDNGSGQVGVKTMGPVTTPTFVSLPAPSISLGSTYSHTCSVDQTGALYCWGANAEGQLAQDDPFPGVGVDRSTPVRVGTDSDWLVADAGQGHTCGIRSPGNLWCWGRNSSGELGIGTLNPGQIRVPLRVGMDTDWADVQIGQSTSCALKKSGSLYCWGDNDSGSGGFGDDNERDSPTQVGMSSNWSVIAVDTFHTCGVQKDGSLYCWGRNVEGQLGLGDNDPRLVPTRVDTATDWVSVAAGRFHTCALKADKSIFCTGQNDQGQLGLGDTNPRTTFTAVTFPP